MQCAQVAKLADIVYKTENTDLQVLAGSAGFLYPALTVGLYSRKPLNTPVLACLDFVLMGSCMLVFCCYCGP